MFQQRIDRLRQTLKEKNIDAMLVSNFYNILYLSGFKTLTENEREAWMLITANNSYLFSDSRYLNVKFQNSNLKSTSQILKLTTPEKGLIKHLEEIFHVENIKNCGIEAEDLKIFEFEQLKRYLPETKFIPTEKLIIRQREIKDKTEIEKIKKACQISDECLVNIVKTIRIGQTEKEIAFRMEFWLKEKGYDLAFYPIVAIDENSALAHYDTRSNGTKKVKNNSIILIDFGAKYQNYLSDITRMIFFGKPNNKQINTYNKLLYAQTKTIQQSRAGSEERQIDSFCRQTITDYQLPNYQHSTGHGVGLEIHEYPKISPVSEEELITNQVITIEPGVYYQNKWGMRIEDTVLVKKGESIPLTKFSKDLLII